MRLLLMSVALMLPAVAVAKDRASFLAGQYATAEQCQKLRKVEAGGAHNVSTAPELLDANGFHGWEGGCEFTKVFEHEPGASWLAFMICSDGPAMSPATYVFAKQEGDDAFEVHSPNDQDGPQLYTRCDAKKGNK